MQTDTKTAISVAIITFNEEERLPRCLASLSFADEIVVVDSQSTDRTVEIAKQFGARVYDKSWQGFGKQKQLAIDYCSNQWVLVLDADEQIPIETAEEIMTTLKSQGSYNSYSLPRKNYFLGRWIKHAGWWPDRVVRLVNKEYCKMSTNLVHESIQTKGEIGTLQSPITHHATRNLEHTLEKINKYSTAGAIELVQRKSACSYVKAFSRAAWAFFYNYIVRLGFLDMGPGFIIAVSDGTNKFFKYAKVIEKQEKSRREEEMPLDT